MDGRFLAAVAAIGMAGCVQGVTQVAGVGATYTTRCSADMTPTDGQYVANCEPARCDASFREAALSHVVVAIVPDVKVLGYAERVCLQDLSDASSHFAPPDPAAAAPAADPSRPTPDQSEGTPPQ